MVKKSFVFALCFILGKVQSDTTAPLVIGGENASRNEFPWLVSVWNLFPNNGTRLCAGTLIDLDLVLTSASCVIGYNQTVTVIAGDHALYQSDGTEQIRLSEDVIIHENFNTTGLLENNIALVRLVSNFKATFAVKPLNLPPLTSDPDTSVSGIVVGWGKKNVSNGDPYSDILQKANVRILSSSVCALIPPVGMVKDEFCTSDIAGGYIGDLGGPLICNDTINAVCGIFSKGEVIVGQTQNLVVGVYLKVSWFLDWIEVHRNNSTEPPSSTTTPFLSSTQGHSLSGGLISINIILFLFCIIFHLL